MSVVREKNPAHIRLDKLLLELAAEGAELTTFIAGCETGGNPAGAAFLRRLHNHLESLRENMADSNEALQERIHALEEVLETKEQMLEEEVKAHETTKAELEGMKAGAERLKAIAGGRSR